MPEPNTPTVPAVYQLRVVLRDISPIIWRRLLVVADTSLAGLHDVLQIVFSWSGEHLHRFVIHGADYDAYAGGDLAQVRLVDLGLRETERFVYDYDLGVPWRHDIRVEQILAADPAGCYPRCTGGRRAGPPGAVAARPAPPGPGMTTTTSAGALARAATAPAAGITGTAVPPA
jgi:Plasmid pRiA4b ORF-3-like protein